MPEPVFKELVMYIMAPETTSTAYPINPPAIGLSLPNLLHLSVYGVVVSNRFGRRDRFTGELQLFPVIWTEDTCLFIRSV